MTEPSAAETHGEPPGAAHSLATTAALALAALVVFVALVALGVWQVHRLHWKLGLIATVDRRVHAPPVPAPPPAQWHQVTAAADEYSHVSVRGTFLNGRETLVQALTALGAGDWVMTPLRTTGGFIVLINRGFVPPERRPPTSRAAGTIEGETTVVGLLRTTEPGGAFLRHNNPATDRWYSRDVAAIAKARGLDDAAPYFIDADATPNAGGYPVGGLTVVAFPNNHLVYAFTWFTLAAMLAGCMAWIVVDRRRAGRSPGDGAAH